MSSLHDKLILLVEDDDSDVELTRRAFDMLDFNARVEIAPDGVAALERLRSASRPDLVLTDIKMPRMNGLELQDRMRADPALKDLPVMFLTSSAERGDRERALSQGALAFLQKPMQLEQYASVILELRRALGA